MVAPMIDWDNPVSRLHAFCRVRDAMCEGMDRQQLADAIGSDVERLHRILDWYCAPTRSELASMFRFGRAMASTMQDQMFAAMPILQQPVPENLQ